MKRLFLLIVFLLVLAIGISFAVHNADPVRLNYHFGSLAAPLSLVVILAVVAGALLGVMTSLWMVFAQKRRAASLRRKLAMCEQEIRNLRQIPIRDKH